VVGYAKPGRYVNGLRNLIAINQPRKVRESICGHGFISSRGHARSKDASSAGDRAKG